VAIIVYSHIIIIVTSLLFFYQKITKRVLPPGLEAYGDITIVSAPHTKVQSTYAIVADSNSRMCISGWKEFMEHEYFLRIGDRRLLLLWVGSEGVFLFVSFISERPLYEN
jgi:hypothetical protein